MKLIGVNHRFINLHFVEVVYSGLYICALVHIFAELLRVSKFVTAKRNFGAADVHFAGDNFTSAAASALSTTFRGACVRE